jgi:CelD/BcsL family acetyltransferase involved in cellulose biosynthesis
VADRYAQRHRERIGVLERKLTVQRDELAMAEREVAEMFQEFRSVASGDRFESVEAAWRDLQAAGGERPELGPDDNDAAALSEDKLKQAIDAQLAYLKRKLGKDKT